MQWLMLLCWGAVAVWGARSRQRRALVRLLFSVGIVLSMLCQLWLLRLNGQLNLSTGLPLHLCSLFGLLSVLLVWQCPHWLYNLAVLLGAPCALLALLFPAIIQSNQPTLMALAFYRLHVLIVCVPMFLHAQGKPLPQNPREAFWLGNGYLLFVSVINHMLGTNYLFLQAAPPGTPLAILFANGTLQYLCSLEMLYMTELCWLSHALKRFEGVQPAVAIARNT